MSVWLEPSCNHHTQAAYSAEKQDEYASLLEGLLVLALLEKLKLIWFQLMIVDLVTVVIHANVG